jgi:hypothetical protein
MSPIVRQTQLRASRPSALRHASWGGQSAQVVAWPSASQRGDQVGLTCARTRINGAPVDECASTGAVANVPVDAGPS